MKKKVFVVAITFSLLLSGILVAVGSGATYGKKEEEPKPFQEIHDWHDLNEIREGLDEDYVLMKDLDENTTGYDDYNTKTENYNVSIYASRGETWDDGDTIELHFDDEDYDDISVEDDEGNSIDHTLDYPTITIDEDTGEKSVYVAYENAVLGWEPIGDRDGSFIGSFDGNGHEIRDLYINRPEIDHGGLFGGLGDEGKVTDVELVDADVSGNQDIGALVGGNYYGTVNNSYATGNVNGMYNVGGLVGSNIGLVNNSYATDDVSGGARLGGLVGRNYEIGTVSNSYSTGKVSGNRELGGLVGDNFDGAVKNSYAIGDVSGNQDVGGLVGYNHHFGTVNSSYATGNVNGVSKVGGLVGSNDGLVNNSYVAGNVNGVSKAGGLVGAGSSIENSHYNIDEVLINGEDHITRGGLFESQYQDWIEDKDLDIADYSDTLVPSNGHYEISSVDGLRDLLGFAGEEQYKFRLTEDINLSDGPGLYIPYLESGFDGNGHTISDLHIDMPFARNVGMFGYVKGTTIAKIGVVDANVSGYENLGGLVGSNSDGSTVSNSYATGNVSGNNGVGGLVGSNGVRSCTVSNSYATGNVSGNSGVGGLVGDNGGRNTRVFNSYATGNVRGDEYVGGVVGDNIDGMVSNSYSTGNVSGDSVVGGLVGRTIDHGRVLDSFWDVETSGIDKSDGGTGLMTDEMTGDEAPQNMDGFDFEETWETVEEDHEDAEKDGYPILQDLSREEQLKYVYQREEYTLTIIVEGGGSTKPEEGIYSHYDGEQVTLEATPAEGWKFVEWTGDATGTDPTINVTMDSNKSITANFEEIVKYDLTINIEGEGSVVPAEGEHTYEKDTKVRVEVIPAEGWRFVEWTGDAAGIDLTINVTMNSNKIITAHFEEKEKAPEFEVTNFTVDVDGLEIKITVDIKNIGNATGTIPLTVDGEEFDTVTLDPGEKETLLKTHEFEEEGEHTVEIGDESETVDVEEEDEGIGMTMSVGIILIILVVLALIGYMMKVGEKRETRMEKESEKTDLPVMEKSEESGEKDKSQWADETKEKILRE